MLWIILLILIFVCIVTAIIYSNHNMKLQWEEATNLDVSFVREAAEYSTTASNTENDLLAIIEAAKAHRTIEMLIRRSQSVHRSSQLTGVDMSEMIQTLGRQYDRALQSFTSKYPQMLPKGELRAYAGFVKERNQSRESGTNYLNDEDPK